jgi:hypothetical protein
MQPARITSLTASFFLIWLLATCGGPQPKRPVPQSRPAVVQPLASLSAPVGPQTLAGLRALAGAPAQCFGLLQSVPGLRIDRIPDQSNSPGCGWRDAGQVRQMAVGLSRQTPLTCPMIAALHLYNRDVLQPAARRHLGVGVARLDVIGTYACRTRNSQPGARMSEHAQANAIDVSGFTLADGRRLTVTKDWANPDPAVRAFMAAARTGGCRTFSTVLGPGSDGFHENHFHFDLARTTWCR